jgi:FKBP-type peptidyl-prolyl cis-trans isomerase SlyD
MKVAKDKVVLISYELEVDGEIMDKATAEKPLDYIHGNNMLIQKLEDGIEGLEEGESYNLTVSAEDAYGVYDPSKLTDLPKSAFEIDGVLHEELLTIGRVIPMLNQMGAVVQGTVKAVEGDTVKMDFNHPLAGKTLHFTGKIEGVRDATEKELKEGLHGEFLPPEEGHHCCGKHGGCGHHGEGEGHCGCHGEGEGHCGCHNED